MRKCFLFFPIALAFLTSVVTHAHSIAVCKLNITNKIITSPEIVRFCDNSNMNVYHVFLSGRLNNNSSRGYSDMTMHFKERSNNHRAIISGQNVDSEINYRGNHVRDAECEKIYVTDDYDAYVKVWNDFTTALSKFERTPYNLYGLNNGRNCSQVIQEVVEEVRSGNHKVRKNPYANINFAPLLTYMRTTGANDLTQIVNVLKFFPSNS